MLTMHFCGCTHLLCQPVRQPPGHHSGIPASVPRGAMCTTGMAMLGSASFQPMGCMLHVSKCGISVDFCMLKPCRAGLHHLPPARVCPGDLFRLSGPWASSSHPISDYFNHFSSKNSLIFQLFTHVCICFGYHHPPINSHRLPIDFH